MINIEEIKSAESKVKTGADFPLFVKEIKALNIIRNDVYVSSGLSIYFDNKDDSVQISPENYPHDLVVNSESSVKKLAHALLVHHKGNSDYFAFCKQAADAGVEKWVTDLKEMSCNYLDINGTILLEEKILNV